jgi:hypothetical protein
VRFDFSVGFVNVSEEMEARFDTEYTTEQRDIAVMYSIRNVQYAIGWLVGNEHVCVEWDTTYSLFILSAQFVSYKHRQSIEAHSIYLYA